MSSSGTQPKVKEEGDALTKQMLAFSTNSGGSEEGMKVVLPNSLFSNNNSGECTILVQIDPKDCSTLDFAGATGAIGRLEADSNGVTFDFKGCQYQGRIYPGATALVLVEVKGKQKDDSSNDYLKVDAITDEFCRLTQTGDALEKLNAVTQGDLYSEEESDGNIGSSNAVAATDDSSSKTMEISAATTKKQAKRKRGSTSVKSSSSSTTDRKSAVKAKRPAANSSKKRKTAGAAVQERKKDK